MSDIESHPLSDSRPKLGIRQISARSAVFKNHGGSSVSHAEPFRPCMTEIRSAVVRRLPTGPRVRMPTLDAPLLAEGVLALGTELQDDAMFADVRKGHRGVKYSLGQNSRNMDHADSSSTDPSSQGQLPGWTSLQSSQVNQPSREGTVARSASFRCGRCLRSSAGSLLYRSKSSP
jgi:hypothetical protein